MNYIDAFVVAVPTDKQAEYIAHARSMVEVFKAYGAIKLVECWGDDVPEGKLTSFPLAVKCEPHETVVFSWIEWPSKAIRDDAMPKLMADPRMNIEDNPMPFDGKRMIFGGFQQVLVG